MNKLSNASIAVVLVAALTGCASRHPQPVPGETVEVAKWRQMATEHDRERLRHWRDAWIAGVDAARKSGNGAAIDAEG
ncbi:hypothetical protein ABTP03_19580, partial [Acinetobacter baumannii]